MELIFFQAYSFDSAWLLFLRTLAGTFLRFLGFQLIQLLTAWTQMHIHNVNVLYIWTWKRNLLTDWHEIKVTGRQTPRGRHYPGPGNREHLSRPIRRAGRVCYWSSDFGPGVLTRSAVGKADKVLACVCISAQVCGTLFVSDLSLILLKQNRSSG